MISAKVRPMTELTIALGATLQDPLILKAGVTLLRIY